MGNNDEDCCCCYCCSFFLSLRSMFVNDGPRTMMEVNGMYRIVSSRLAPDSSFLHYYTSDSVLVSVSASSSSSAKAATINSVKETEDE